MNMPIPQFYRAKRRKYAAKKIMTHYKKVVNLYMYIKVKF